MKEVESFEEEDELLELRHAALQSKRYQNDGDQDGPNHTVSITCRHTYVSHLNKIMVKLNLQILTNREVDNYVQTQTGDPCWICNEIRVVLRNCAFLNALKFHYFD